MKEFKEFFCHFFWLNSHFFTRIMKLFTSISCWNKPLSNPTLLNLFFWWQTQSGCRAGGTEASFPPHATCFGVSQQTFGASCVIFEPCRNCKFCLHTLSVKSQSAFEVYPKMKCVILDFRFTQLPVIQELISTLATDVSFPKLFFGGLGVFSIVLNAICALNLDRINQWENVPLVDNSVKRSCRNLSWNDSGVTPAVTGAGTVWRKSRRGRWCDMLDLHPQPN